MGMFKRGFNAVNEEKQRQEEQKSRGNGLFRFFLSKDKEEADVTFLTEQPVNYYEHTLKTKVNGKDKYTNVPCIGEGCKHCADGDRPSFKSAWLIVDHRENTYTDKEGKKQTSTDNVRLLVYGTKIASQLDRKSEKYGLTGRFYTIVRLGTGTSTTYTFEHGDKYELTSKEIEDLLPDFISEMYDGTMDSLYSIIESQIEMLVDDAPTNKTTKEEEDIDDELVSTDEEEEPRRSKLPLRKRTVENSVKPSVKSLLKKKRVG